LKAANLEDRRSCTKRQQSDVSDFGEWRGQ
jgi:hypothetical protein